MNETEQMAAEIAEELHPVVQLLRRKTRDDYPRPNITVNEYMEEKKREGLAYTRAQAYTDLKSGEDRGLLKSAKVTIDAKLQRIWWVIHPSQ